ncbi:YaiO family outer membrane beta-barrel protein [Lentisalinibacter sediminis]|uniref:YaiO family outer membrane beta-barrel protein n=1 Tax=Lentisalinibacter sediminis TaxID=2992237 RepID=UPI00386E8166
MSRPALRFVQAGLLAGLLAAGVPVAAAAADQATPTDPATAADAAIGERDWPAARALLRDALAERPGDPALRFRLAQVLRWSGEPRGALAEYDALLDEFPDNVDYVYGRALALEQLGREAEALEGARRAARLAPEYEAVRRLEQRLAEDENPDAAHAGTRYFLTAGAGYEDLTNGLPGWQQQFLRLDGETAASGDYHVSLGRYERFDRSDLEFGVGGIWQAGEDWTLQAELALGGDADFLPDTGFYGRVLRTLGDGWNAAAAFRHRRYETTTVSTWSAEAERYFGDYRASYTLNASRLHGATTSLSHVVSLGWYPRAGLSFGLVAATGEETEVVAPGQVLETDVDSLALTGRHALAPRITLDWWLGTHAQGDIYRRRYAGLAVRFGL